MEWSNARIGLQVRSILINEHVITQDRLNYDPNNLDKMTNVHERAAARLLHVCKKNGFVFVHSVYPLVITDAPTNDV